MLRLARMALAHPIWWLGTALLLTLVAALGLTRLEIRTDGASLHPVGNPVVKHTTEDRELFGEPERLLLLLRTREGGPPVASQEGLLYLEKVHEAVAGLPGVRKDGVYSLVNQLDTPDKPNLLCLPAYLDSVPTSPAAFIDLMSRIRSTPFVNGMLLARDGQAAALLITMDGEQERGAFVATLEDWVATQARTAFHLDVTGPVIAEVKLGEMVLRDLSRLVPFMILVVALFLFFALNTTSGVVLAMAEVGFVLIWTLGLMGYTHVPVTLVTTILPIILMTMAITDEIHFLERFQSKLPDLSGLDRAARKAQLAQTVLAALEEVGRPILVTSVTTAAGFLSFLHVSMTPLRHFGVFTALGILIAMLMSFTLIPAMILLFPPSWFRPVLRRGPKPGAGDLPAVDRWFLHPASKWVLAGLLLLGVPGIRRLSVQDAWVDNFDPASSLVTADREFNARFWGSYRFDLVLKGEPGLFHGRTGTVLVEELVALAQAGPGVGGVYSYLVPFRKVAELQKSAAEGFTEARLTKILQVMKFIGSRMAIHELMTPSGDAVRLQLFVKNPDYQLGKELKTYLEQELAKRLPPGAPVSYHFSGDLPVAVEVVGGIVFNQLSSISWTIAGVGLLLWLLFPEKRTALPVLLPVLAAAGLLLAGMGLLGLDLGIATSMFTALTIGVGVDFAIHFSHGYRTRRQQGRDHLTATVETLAHSGKALRWNMLVLASGFLVLTFSALKPNHELGLLLAAAMVASYGTTLVLLPWLLGKLTHI